MKKFISVALVASMVASMGVTAFASSDYEAKDKDLEFFTQLYYDGRGADELWLPIVVNKGGEKHFITDGNDNASIIQDAQDSLADATADLAVYNAVVAQLTANAASYPDKAAVDAAIQAQLGTKDPLQVSNVAFNGDTFDAEEYAKEAINVYKKGPIANLNSLIGSCNQIIQLLDGSTYGDPIEYDNIEDVNDVEIKWKAKRGGTLVSDVYVDEVSDLGGVYCVVIELNDNLKTAVDYLNGTLKMESGKNRKLDEQDIRYNYYNKAAYSNPTYNGMIGDIENGYVMDGGDNYINLVDFNDKYTIAFFKKNAEWVEIEDNNGFYYEVDLSDQGKINLIYNNNAIDAVTNVASEDAVLTFYNFEARPTFDFAGKVTITPPEEYDEFDIETLHLYTYEKDGSLKEVKQAKVGEDGDTLEFKSYQLGKFVLSSEELTLLSDAERAALEALKEAEANGEAVTDDGAVVDENKTNPGTGL